MRLEAYSGASRPQEGKEAVQGTKARACRSAARSPFGSAMSLFPHFSRVLREIASRVSATAGRAQSDVPTDSHDIAARLDRLDAVQLAELGTALAALWDALNEQFDGIDGFLRASATDQSAY